MAANTIFVRVLVSFISLRMVSHITKIGSTHPQPRGINSAKNSSIILIIILLNFYFLEPIHIYNSSEEQKVTSEILFLQNKCVLMLQRYKKAGIYIPRKQEKVTKLHLYHTICRDGSTAVYGKGKG